MPVNWGLSLKSFGILWLLCASLFCAKVSAADKITIQLKWYHKYQFAGYYAAQFKGYFEQEGLQVDLIEGGPAVNPQHQLINNQAQYATLGSEVVKSFAVGAPFIIVSSIYQHSPEVLITLESAKVTELSDLRGQAIMLNSDEVAGQIMAMLAQNGLRQGDYQAFKYDGNINLLADQTVAAIYGYISNEPYLLQQMGYPNRVFAPQDYGFDFYGDSLVTTQSELAEHPKRIEMVRRAVIRGWNYALENPQEVIDYILTLESKNPVPYDLNHQLYEAEQTAKLVDATNIPLGNTSADRWAAMFDTFNNYQAGQAKFLARYVYDPSVSDKHWQKKLLVIIAVVLACLAMMYFWNRSLRLKLNRAVEHLDKIAFEDKLTLLPNRSAMLLHFEEFRKLKKSDRYLALFDIANLQKVNKTQGFQKADQLIQQIGEMLEQKKASQDRCFSLYGGKFAIVGKATDRSEFERRMNQIILEITKALNSIKLHSGGIELDFSLDNSNLTIRGELALQHAKSVNAPLLVFFNKLIAENIERQEELYRRVREAIVYNEFVVFYQPKVNATTAKVEGVEALMRWQHPDDGLLTPFHFLPTVENFPELMEQLEDCILELIFSQIDSITHHFGATAGFRVSINLSSMQFNRPSLLDYLLTKCKRHNVNPEQIDLELTESSMLEDLETAINISQQLQSAGFHVSLDDFGTGYSSLSYIQNLPVNIVKLDHSFVKNIPQDTRSGYVVEHIVSLAHKLGLKIVAEGVEREEQLHYLDNLDVDLIQGYYFYKPMSISDLFEIPNDTLAFD